MFIRSKHIIVIIILIAQLLVAQGNEVIKLKVKENQGLERNLEYVEFSCMLNNDVLQNGKQSLYAIEKGTNNEIECQTIIEDSDSLNKQLLVRIIFPVSIKSLEEKIYLIYPKIKAVSSQSNLLLKGRGTELFIENEFYSADLRKDASVEGHSYNSGQIRELKIKLGFDQQVRNVEDRLHWAPNFKKPEHEYYTTIAHWNNPKVNEIVKGPYQISTYREDLAPNHPEILLSARYSFYEGLPYFRFYSSMEMQNNIWLELLRNDEMAMDSMFTHMAFQRPNGKIVDIEFSQRYKLLNKLPIENNSPWLCFYNINEGFAFGTIRINYDNTNNSGGESPTYKAHTQIGEWLKGVKYWNRRLIHDHLTFVPKGSCYTEENVYLVFKVDEFDKLKDIKYWAERIRSPLQVRIKNLLYK